MDEPFLLLGEHVRLRSTTGEDGPRLIEIRSMPEVFARWRGEELEAEFADDLVDKGHHLLTIESPDEEVVGLVQFSEEEDPDYRHASIDIYIDPVFHRRGYAVDAIRTVVSNLLQDRGHHRLTIDPVTGNEPAIECYLKAGFQPVGVMRAYERQSDGSWADGLLMELLATDLIE